MNALIDCMWKTGVVALTVWMLTALLHRRAAALRHALWIGALVAFLLIPASAPLSRRSAGIPVRVPLRISAVPLAPAPVPDVPSPQTAPARRNDSGWWWAGAWILGAAFLVVRRVRASLRMRGIAGRSVSGLPDDPQVRLSSEISAPLTWGFLDPAILFPASARSWEPSLFQAVLEHEREHIRRRDTVAHWLGESVCIVWWFHPLAWLARNRAAYERECSCDDAVLRSGVRASDYAAGLLNIVSNRMVSHRKGEMQMALSAVSRFEKRMTNLLRRDADRSPVSLRAMLAVTLAVSASVFPLVLLRAQAPAGQGDLAGSVSDASGARIPGGIVTVSGSGGNREITRADETGNWVFHGIPAGHYVVQMDRRGFVRYSHAVDVEAGAHANLDAVLSVGSMQETINVVAQGQARSNSTAPAGETQRIRVGGNVQAAQLLRQIKPAYPDSARAQGIEGTVLLHAVIGTDGAPLSLSVMNKLADPDLAAAALDSARQWRYQPTLLNGVPVEVETTITVNFRLQ
jgi:TonB family protein